MSLRKGFTRYAFSIQYHGSSHLGFAHLPKQENQILDDGTDLRGYRSVEGRLRDAFHSMIGSDNYENIRVSSRTDRGVHALKNTCHVDISKRSDGNAWDTHVLRKGLNYYLSQEGAEVLKHNLKCNTEETANSRYLYRRSRRKMDNWSFHYPMNELRILNVIGAPLMMKNKFKTHDNDQPEEVEWNVRFSANQRTYMYRILAGNDDMMDWAVPFEWDRSWRVLPPKPKDKKRQRKEKESAGALDIEAMKRAAAHLLGTHDFSSFRAARCQRDSPIVTMKDLRIVAQPYGEPLLWESTGGLLGMGDNGDDMISQQIPQLITIKVVGSAFVYHQVRNMVGALVAVGRGTIDADDMEHILAARDRTIAPPMAPAHGLFLVDVRHDDIEL